MLDSYRLVTDNCDLVDGIIWNNVVSTKTLYVLAKLISKKNQMETELTRAEQDNSSDDGNLNY